MNTDVAERSTQPASADAGPLHGRARSLVVAVATLAVDQLTKVLAVAFVGDDPSTWGPFHLRVIRNAGGPLGLGSGATWVWTALGVVAVAAVGVAVLRRHVPGSYALTVGVVAGGALGNLADRLFRSPGVGRGAVVDWIVIDPYPKVFNLADVALRAGVVVLFVSAVRRSDRA